MRITIDTDDKGKVSVDTGTGTDTGINAGEKPGMFESTADVPVIDAGPAPLQEIERLQKGIPATEVSSISARASAEDREAQLPLNPLRAGAAAAYRDPANLRKRAAESEGAPVAQATAAAEGMSAAQDQSMVIIDGGSAHIPEDKRSDTPHDRKP